MIVNGNLTLNAQGQSEVQNLVIERVSTIPTFLSSEAGRVIYHTSESTFYMNNGVQWIKIATGGDAAALENEVAAIELAVGLANNGGFIPWTGSTYLSTATTIRDGVAALDSAIAGEVTARNAAISSVVASVNTETSRATAAEDALDTKIDQETSRATTAESALSADIATETTRATNAENTLDAKIDTETTRAEGAEATLLAAINTEKTRAEGAEATLQTAITAEVTRATAAESVLTSSVGTLNTELDALEATVTANAAADAAAIDARVLKAGDSMTGNLAMNGNRVTGIATPVGATDAVNKEYLEQLVATQRIWRDPVRAARMRGYTSGTHLATETFAYADSVILKDGGAGFLPPFNDAAFEEGSILQFVGQAGADATDIGNWREIQNGPFAPAESAFIVASNKFADFAFAVDQIITYKDSAFVAYTPKIGDTVLVSDEQSADFGNTFTYIKDDTNVLRWIQTSGANSIGAGLGLKYTGNILHVNLGAGIAELPSDEVGLDVYSASGLMLSTDGSTPSASADAKLALRFDGTTIVGSSNGIRVAQSVLDSVTDVANDLADEVVRATAAETSLSAAIATETTNRVAAIDDVQGQVADVRGDLSALTVQNQADHQALQSAITTEATDRANADSALNTNLTNQINALNSTLDTRCDAIENRLDRSYFLYTSSAAATTHNIAHNTGRRFPIVSVYFADTGEQIMPQSVIPIDDNNLVVTVNQAINCKVAVMGVYSPV